jgi:hypothetical protein
MTIKIDSKNLKLNFDKSIFDDLEYSSDVFNSHQDIANKLKDERPYLITVIIDQLEPEFWNRKECVKKTKREINSKYVELLYKYFDEEYGQLKGGEIYAQWLDKYRSIWKEEGIKKELDDYIIEHELESKYKKKILSRFKNIKNLKALHYYTNRSRYYNLPGHLKQVDWRNPYDNIFVCYDDNKKLIRRGGSGSSSSRETNSLFIFGFALINQIQPIPSYLFLYSKNNELVFIKKFKSLTIPNYDIRSNYSLDWQKQEKILKGNQWYEPQSKLWTLIS